ncbi:MAG: hypothetical protein FWC58_01225 [Desulfobulbus sp.]|nr:hypothetical protein [Desulfobulbus sp.]
MEAVLNKLREPSTWKGLGWLLVAIGAIPVGAIDGFMTAGVALVGVAEVIRSETK